MEQVSQQGSQSSLSQLDRVRNKNLIRVAFVENKAYWVHENKFYEADIVDGFVQHNDAKQIDAHNLSESEFSALLEILDNLS